MSDPSSSLPRAAQVREEAERLLIDITPGAWRTHQYDPDDDLFVVLDDNEPGVAEIARIEDQFEATANAHFIAAAPRLVRQLLALLATLQSREQAQEPETEQPKEEIISDFHNRWNRLALDGARKDRRQP